MLDQNMARAEELCTREERDFLAACRREEPSKGQALLRQQIKETRRLRDHYQRIADGPPRSAEGLTVEQAADKSELFQTVLDDLENRLLRMVQMAP